MTLPKGWIEAKIGDVVMPIETIDPGTRGPGSFRYVDIGSIDNKTHRIAKPKQIANKEAPSRARRRINANDVLFSTVRPYLKNIASVPEELDGEVTSTGICVLRADSGIEPRFLFYRVLSDDFVERMTRASDGTVYPAITDRDIFESLIAIPPSAEQRRIVVKLDVLAACLARARGEVSRTLSLVAAQRRSMLNSAFSEVRLAKWPSSHIGDVIAEGLIGLVRSKSEQGDKGVPYIRMNHFDMDGRFNDFDLTRVECTAEEMRRFELREDDVLFNTRNSVELVGKVAIWPARRPSFVYNNNILRLRFRPEVDARFAFRYLMSPHFRSKIENEKSATTSVAAIYQRSLYRISMPVPSLNSQELGSGLID